MARTGLRANFHDEFEGSLGEALLRCAELVAKDKGAERQVKIAGFGIFFSILGTLIAFICLMITVEDPGGPEWYNIVSLVVGITAAAGFILWSLSASTGDFEDRRLAVVQRLLESLGPELKKGTPIRWRVEFRPYDHKAHNSSGQQVFEQQWLSLDFVLMDGTAVRCEVGVHVKQKRRRKRKYTKIKERFYERLIVRIKPPSGAVLGQAPRNGGQLARGKLKLHRVRVRPRAADLEWRTDIGTRVYNRAGWSGNSSMGEISPKRLLLGVIGSHKLVATGQQAVEPGAPPQGM